MPTTTQEKTAMSETFDPYYKWLGIPPDEQPPNHYRLLGISAFESDDEVITRAADRLIAYVQDLQRGKHAGLAVQIRNEVSNARVCLLNTEKKAEYDRRLREQLAPPTPAPPAPEPRRVVPVEVIDAEVVAEPRVVAPAQFDRKPDASRAAGLSPSTQPGRLGHPAPATRPTTVRPAAPPIDVGKAAREWFALVGGWLLLPVRGIDRGLEALAEGMAGDDHRILHNFFRVGFCAVAVGVMTLLWFGPNRDAASVGRVSNPSSARAGPPATRAAPAPAPAPDGLESRPTPAPAGKELTVDLGGGVTMQFVLIAPGEFMMGSPDSDSDADADEKPQHRVRITQPFYVGKHEVTQAQWQAVMGNNLSYFTGDRQRPVEQVSWEDAVGFCARLSQKEGKTYRLPTEAEWEYACRAGSTTKWCFGDSESQLGDYAWYGLHSGSSTHPVGGKKQNAWGLYDMHGNVWEWCADCSDGNYYGSSPLNDPKGPSSGAYRALRGGAWQISAGDSRSANRAAYLPVVFWGHNLGLRVVRTP
jgi:formylglycine-generating enzyme required for sulfatase activity